MTQPSVLLFLPPPLPRDVLCPPSIRLFTSAKSFLDLSFELKGGEREEGGRGGGGGRNYGPADEKHSLNPPSVLQNCRRRLLLLHTLLPLLYVPERCRLEEAEER